MEALQLFEVDVVMMGRPGVSTMSVWNEEDVNNE